MGKVISFEPRVGKAQTDQTSSEFAVIIPINKYNKWQNSFCLVKAIISLPYQLFLHSCILDYGQI